MIRLSCLGVSSFFPRCFAYREIRSFSFIMYLLPRLDCDPDCKRRDEQESILPGYDVVGCPQRLECQCEHPSCLSPVVADEPQREAVQHCQHQGTYKEHFTRS